MGRELSFVEILPLCSLNLEHGNCLSSLLLQGTNKIFFLFLFPFEVFLERGDNLVGWFLTSINGQVTVL